MKKETQEKKFKLISWEVGSFCRNNHYATGMTISQWNKLLHKVDDCPWTDIHILAVLIWFCSDTEKSIEEIEEELKAVARVIE